MVLISDNHEHMIRDPKYITLKQIDDIGFAILADTVMMGLTRSYSLGLIEMSNIADAIRTDRHYQVASSYE